MFKFLNKILVDNSRDQYLEKYDGKDLSKFNNNTGFNVLISIIITFSLIAVFFVSSSKPETEFLMVNIEKKELRTLKTFKNPIISASAIERWNSNALTNIFTFNFTNYKNHFNKSKIFFTTGGYKGFYQSLENSGMIDTVSRSSLEVTLTPLSKSMIVKKTNNGNETRWTVETSVFISYMGASTPKHEKVYIVTELVQVPTNENPNGVAISRINMFKM